MAKKTLVQLILNSLNKYAPHDDFVFTKIGDKYDGIDRIELFNRVFILRNFLYKLNLQQGSKLAIISENRTEWIITDLACVLSGFVNVPIYTTLSPESIKYILNDSQCTVCFVSNNLQLDKVLKVQHDLPDLKYIVSYNDIKANSLGKQIISFSEILKENQHLDRKKMIIKVEEILKKVNEDDLLTIIYTSGTTGVPKGVMLTQKNLYSNVISCTKTLPINEKDIFLSYLPYSHIFERTAGYYLAFFTGAKIYYAQSIDTIGVQMAEVKPTMVMTVPRLLDKMYNRLMKSGDDMPDGYKKKLFLFAIYYAKTHGKNVNSLRWKLLDKLVYKKIREKTGGRLRFFVSGGGALNKAVGEFFEAIGITTLEGYGMTETSPVISVNLPDYLMFGSVGRPLQGVEVKIAEDGEILAKGDLVMKGYYNNQEETDAVIIDGWMHTGDLGMWNEKGNLVITDRKKSLFKSSGGKYIAPAHIEDLVLQLPYVDQVLVIGNERMYVTALIVPELNELANLARKIEADVSVESELLTNPKILKKIESDINEVQVNLATHEKIRKFTLLNHPFTIEAGELTPTLKIKRKFVEEKYKDAIEQMYHRV
ncbi:MAG: long-chain fatty acid--CoA ligase [Ignavibacteriae bacterium]|nr:long-chain fatty acid--CoA ligase [Ignavibacteriota bacterium]